MDQQQQQQQDQPPRPARPYGSPSEALRRRMHLIRRQPPAPQATAISQAQESRQRARQRRTEARDAEFDGHMREILNNFYQFVYQGRGARNNNNNNPAEAAPAANLQPSVGEEGTESNSRPYNLRSRSSSTAPASTATTSTAARTQPVPAVRPSGTRRDWALDFLANIIPPDYEPSPIRLDRYAAPPELTPEELKQERLDLAAKLPPAIADNSHACAICLDAITLKTLITPCFHQYCLSCLFEWCKLKNFCPVCRQKVGKVIYNIHSADKFDTFASAGMELPAVHDFGIGIPPLTPALKHRTERILLIQMLARLYEKHPAGGFPIFTIDYKLFEEVALTDSAAAANIANTDRHFRCFIYLHGYRPLSERSWDVPTVEDPTTSPATRARLLAFLKTDLEVLSDVLETGLEDETKMEGLLRQIEELLTKVHIQSAPFAAAFKKALEKSTKLKAAVPYYDITGKVLAELINYWQTTQYATHQFYITGSLCYNARQSRDNELFLLRERQLALTGSSSILLNPVGLLNKKTTATTKKSTPTATATMASTGTQT